MGFHSRRLRTRRFTAFFLAAGALGAAFPAASARAAVFADQVSSYSPGTAPANFQTSSAALGPITGNTTFGGLNPFNPPFDPGHVVIVGAGGSLTVRLAAPVAGPAAAVGVFVNNGLVDVSADGSGQAGSPPATFSAPPQSLISVSSNGASFVPLNGGQPVTFDNPTNAFLDTPITEYFQAIGTQPADQSKPFNGRLADFANETYGQMRTRLAGSAGGTWLGLSGSGLAEVRYVRFDVPAGAGYRMVVDSVSAVPEPGAIASGAVGIAAMLRRRRRVSA